MEKIAIHCETREDFDRVCDLQPNHWKNSRKQVWANIKGFNDRNKKGCMALRGGVWGHCDSQWYKDMGFTIVTATKYFKNNQKEETKMRKCISEVFGKDKLEDALLVEKYAGYLLPSSGTGGSDDLTTVLTVKANKQAILKEAQRLEEESNKD